MLAINNSQDNSLFRIEPWGTPLDADFLTQIRDQGKGIILIEAAKATTQPLVLEVRQGTNVLASTALYLSITEVEQMFRHKNLTSNAPPYGLDGMADRLTASDVPNEPETNAKNFVFVHGYNVLGEEARGTFADMFKRMYWAGSHAKFYGVTWRGASTKGTAPFGNLLTPNYHTNVVNAFQTAPYLASFVNSLTNSGPVTLAAHSLGNMVTLSAINDWNAPISQYFMMDAAVPIEAIDPTATTNIMIYSTWTNYSSRLFASDWSQLFTNDARSTLSWNNRLGNLRNVDVYNFFSSGEEVLRTTPVDPPSDVLNKVATQLEYHFWDGYPFGSFTWYWQEKGKGTCSQDWFLGSSHGGWSFTVSTNYRVPTNFVVYIDGQYVTNQAWNTMSPSQAQAANISDAALRTNSFFSFPSVVFPSITADSALLGSGGSAYAQTNRNRILADAIPVMSLVIGANPVPKFANNHNLNMNSLQFQNGWPQGRIGGEVGMWHHSDYHEVAYSFTYKLFDQFIMIGNLK